MEFYVEAWEQLLLLAAKFKRPYQSSLESLAAGRGRSPGWRVDLHQTE
jgi:hypothetical protein